MNKVQFQADPTIVADGELSNELLCQLIEDAETEVEQDLRGRYQIPFQSISDGTYSALPDHTKRALRVAVDMMAVMKIMETDFGRGSHINSEDYSDPTEKHYNKYIDRLMGRDKEGAGDKHDRFRFSPPLDGLSLAFSNREADDGFKGRIINTDGSQVGIETYAGDQINNPGQTYISKRQIGITGGS